MHDYAPKVYTYSSPHCLFRMISSSLKIPHMAHFQPCNFAASE